MNPFSKISRAIRYRRHYSFEKLPALFIVSTGRTGTQFFETLFKEFYPNILGLHEPSPDLFEVGMKKFREGKSEGEILKAIRTARFPYIEQMMNEERETYLESNPNLFCLIPELRKAFPKARFVRIVRDPKTYLPSAYSKSPTGDQRRFFYADDDGRKRLTPMDVGDEESAAFWPSFDRFERIAWFWNACNRILDEDLRKGNDYITLRYEEIFNKDGSFEAIRSMSQFLGLSTDHLKEDDLRRVLSKRKNQTKEAKIGGRETWTGEQTQRFNELTQEMRNQFSYDEA